MPHNASTLLSVNHPNGMSAETLLESFQSVSQFKRLAAVAAAHNSSALCGSLPPLSKPTPVYRAKGPGSGSSVKTAKVWRFFDQLPAPEQAASCKICGKTIKATNSSTTGMIRHLRSCHVHQYQQLQEARQSSLALKNSVSTKPAEERAREQLLREFNTQLPPKPQEVAASSTVASSQENDATSSSSVASLSPPRSSFSTSGPAPHSIDALVAQRRPPMGQAPGLALDLPQLPSSFEHALNNLKALTSQTMKSASGDAQPLDMSKQFIHNESAVKQAVKRVVDLSQSLPKRQKLSPPPKAEQEQPPNPVNLSVDEWGEGHPEAKKLTNQIAMMLLVDRQHPTMVDRGGFRALLQSMFPKYRMPSAEKFQTDILPSLLNQLNFSPLRSDFAMKFWQNNMFSSHNLTAPVNTATADITGLISPTTTVESGRSDSSTSSSLGDRDDIENDAPTRLPAPPAVAIDRTTLQNSIRSAQNISRSFSHSLQLGIVEDDSDSSSSADSDISLQDKLDAFLEFIGRYVFPYDEVVSLVSRCQLVFQHFEHSPLDCAYLQALIASNGQGKLTIPHLENGQPELVRSVQFVLRYFGEIMKCHESQPIPDFLAFSAEERQFLADLNDHVAAL
uniref:BED-type domain-containing protein n=1 Tax=Steinernema glaseri TaxID=37863 RepID=A0A1I8AMU2_9BILA